MNINDYNSKNMGKQVLVLGKDDIKVLNHFASIAKSGELKGLIVAGKYVGFTDTYRLASIKDTHEDLPGTYAPLIFPILEELKKANSIAVLKDGKIAVQVEMEVTEYESLKDIKVPNISKVVEDLEYESYSEAFPSINFAENVVWKMLKLVGGKEYFTRFFNFENGKVSVEAYPNDESKLFLEIMELDNTKASLKTALDFKYVDLWFKWIKDNTFNIALGKNNRSAVKFSKNNTDYIIMPMAIKGC